MALIITRREEQCGRSVPQERGQREEGKDVGNDIYPNP
jgi:hypothetical protein